jgi:2-polyprenyl-3-methyl-5-hydroxy-6-metoxy-1,4-benzoquinol methylase
MAATQQEQTKQYFRSVATDWQNKSVNASGGYSVIESRNRAVLDVVSRTKNANHFLDVGCGTGQLVIAVAQRGLEAEGIDFAAEMVIQCEANARAAGVSARFLGGSFFESQFEEHAYDVISAQGFIEYLSPDETDEFFRRSAKMLRPGGAIVVGSRNRLFNAFSLNDFTRLEAEMGVLGILIAEATALQSSPTTEAAFLALRRYERIDPQPDRHPVTGVPVEARYQYAPADLVYRLRLCGLTAQSLFPVHFHGLPSTVKAEHLEFHSEIALAAAEIGFRDHRFVPFSSSFVIEARR